MKKIGIYLVVAAIGSVLLNQFGYEFSLLMWIDIWGETIGWAIRGGALVVGGVLVFVGMQQEQQEASGNVEPE